MSCHSGEEPAAGLNLGVRASLLTEADSGEIPVVPGQPDASELLRRVTAGEAWERMPPEGEDPLSAAAIDTIRRWIAAGAAWGGHWAFQPLADPARPATARTDWTRNEIDFFVLSRLESQGLTPAPEADRFTLIKRLYYDLVGLPPTIEEVDRFVQDTSPDAYEALVSRLLESPHFGERWGRHWLDLAHYADSDGYEKDRARPDAYLYRDWVIEAFNSDMPYDQFTIEQLAGDLLPERGGSQRVATGFLRQTLTNEEGGVDQEEYRIAAAFDRTETTGAIWLGLTIGCARCHSHKYDPLPHEEYYRFFAFFNNSEEVAASLPVAAKDLDELQRKLQPLEQARAAREADLAPRAMAWADAQHQRILAQAEGGLKEQPLVIESVQPEASSPQDVRIEKDRVVMYAPAPADAARPTGSEPPDKDTYLVTARAEPARVTGFKLWAERDDNLPGKGPGRAANGNFVLTGFRVLHIDSSGKEQSVALHRARADYSQSGFSPAAVLQEGTSAGWAVGGKLGADHWIQFRTLEPLEIAAGDRLKVELAQQYGGGHTLGRFRLSVLSGNERGLHLPDEQIASALEMYPEKRIASTRRRLFDYFVEAVERDEPLRAIRAQVAELHKQYGAKLMNVRVIGAPLTPRATHIFDRGDFLSPRQEVTPGVPAILASFQPRSEAADRLDLARWLVSDENFLTPRVAVNQIWQHLFGHGLVRTPGDLGVRGQAPSHLELLDWLARRFQSELRWSRKGLIRLIVNSATYRQASHYRGEYETRDPLNESLFRQNRFRVEAEIVRDLHLAVSGLLTPKVGGPSVYPPMPEDLAKLSYADNFSWKNSQGEDRYRRGLYTFFKRTIPHPNLMTFDAPDANVACPARTVSNTPLQALTLLNNEAHFEAAQALARRVLTEPELAGDSARLAFALRCCVARHARSNELETLQRLLTTARRYFADHPEAAQLVVGPYESSDVSPAETAAWVATLRAVLNLDEFVTRE